MSVVLHSPGSLVRARGREWIVLTGSEPETLKVRPLTGSEDDVTVIHTPLEREPVAAARFPDPGPEQMGAHEPLLLLRDALLLSLRRGAGPFRSFGHLAVEPRAYQLVPLLMALKQDVVRLLIADDVGIGKTIEAGLIARELLDRGDIERSVVICPPHLVDQWIDELERRFHVHAVAVTAATAARLERDLPPSSSIFAVHPHAVVSLDYIKQDRRRVDFLNSCPEFVIVDEAHSCAATGVGRHQRYELLRGLAEDGDRHLVLLTATPHSGDEAAFYRLLGLLDPAFENLSAAEGAERTRLRDRLAQHFVQRRRPDIAEWQDTTFARRESTELTYTLDGEWDRFFSAVLDYCAGKVSANAGDARRQRLDFWGTLALMRCVASSPAAGLQALRTRAQGDDDETLADQIFDGAADALPDDDVEPPAGGDDHDLRRLITQAEGLLKTGKDPKLQRLADHLTALVAEGFSPVVFCRYIATAHYLAERLRPRLATVALGVATGEQTGDERRAVIDRLGAADQPQRLLIATDCLSEGINLQEHFDAVVHYDLSWNPTRHEQREGRVDRFGQRRRVVRATLLYGANNPVDGAVLEVILRKAARIRKDLGVPVPLPDDGHQLTQALLRAVLLRRRDGAQQVLDFAASAEAAAIETTWQDVAAKASRSRTVFAQRSLKPDEVLPEWRRTLASLGGPDDVQRFVTRAAARLGAPLGGRAAGGHTLAIAGLPVEVRERLDAEQLAGTLAIDFGQTSARGCRAIPRSHPLVGVLADTLIERTLAGDAPAGDPMVLGRVGCWVSADVTVRTVVTVLRLRHRLVTQRGTRPVRRDNAAADRGATTLLVEEAGALAWEGAAGRVASRQDDDALALLRPTPVSDPPPHVRERFVREALAELAARSGDLDAYASTRAQQLLEDHRRVREASGARGSYSVSPLLPVDVIALVVLLPRSA